MLTPRRGNLQARLPTLGNGPSEIFAVSCRAETYVEGGEKAVRKQSVHWCGCRDCGWRSFKITREKVSSGTAGLCSHFLSLCWSMHSKYGIVRCGRMKGGKWGRREAGRRRRMRFGGRRDAGFEECRSMRRLVRKLAAGASLAGAFVCFISVLGQAACQAFWKRVGTAGHGSSRLFHLLALKPPHLVHGSDLVREISSRISPFHPGMSSINTFRKNG